MPALRDNDVMRRHKKSHWRICGTIFRRSN